MDSDSNIISTNDVGFYWAYVKQTQTNFGRHIFYDTNNPGTYASQGVDVIYDLSKYNMDIVVHEGEMVIPYYIANQLFAGSSLL